MVARKNPTAVQTLPGSYKTFRSKDYSSNVTGSRDERQAIISIASQFCALETLVRDTEATLERLRMRIDCLEANYQSLIELN